MKKNAVAFVGKITKNTAKKLTFLLVLASNWMVKNHQKQPKDRGRLVGLFCCPSKMNIRQYFFKHPKKLTQYCHFVAYYDTLCAKVSKKFQKNSNFFSKPPFQGRFYMV